MEESKEYKEFILFKEKKEIYVKELEEKMEMLKEIQKPKVSDYEIPIKNITERDKSYLIKEGVMDLDIKEQVDSYINYNLEEELCRHGLATNFNFQFLSFKPSRVYYSDLRNVPAVPLELRTCDHLRNVRSCFPFITFVFSIWVDKRIQNAF